MESHEVSWPLHLLCGSIAVAPVDDTALREPPREGGGLGWSKRARAACPAAAAESLGALRGSKTNQAIWYRVYSVG